MKVAILSMQEVKNYGSFLQAYSLKSNIESLGHTCDFINIIPGEQLPDCKQEPFYKWKLLLRRLQNRNFAKNLKTIYKFQTRFSKEFLPYLGVRSGRNIGYYDVVVIGSDEVFHCTQKSWFGFSRQLFGEGLNAGKVITYAASFGATTASNLQLMGIKEIVAELLKKIDCISVRDDNSFGIIKLLTGREPCKNVDPVLIYNYDRLMPVGINKSRYVIVYTYPGRITDEKEIIAIRCFAKSRGLRLISIGHYFSWCDDVVVPTPFEVLAYFKHASYIVTDTFHGTIFSIKYNKQFATIIRDMNSQKLSHLLQQFGLEDRTVKNINKLDEIIENPIDYVSVNSRIAEEVKHSLEFLKCNLCL